jgi:hypothetical protein
MKQRPMPPDHRVFKCCDAAMWQRGKTGVKLCVELRPRRFVSPFQMRSVRSSIVMPRAILCDAERPIATSKRAQECRFQHVADVAGKLIAPSFSWR